MRTLLIILALFPALCLFTSCEDEKIDDNTPVIKYIRLVNVEKSDSLLTTAYLGSTIAIMGDHLSNVKEVWFNDQQAKVNPLYVQSNNILVTIPSEIPKVFTDEIRLVTKSGKTTIYTFEVKIPAPTVTSLKCEYVPDGDIAVIYGDYFIEPKVYFSGNMQAEIVEFTKTEIQVIVPDGATAGKITVQTAFGNTRSPFAFRDNELVTPTTKLFLDLESTSWNNWNRGAFDTEGGISGQYLKLAGQTGDWAWPVDAMQLYYNNPSRQAIVSDGDIENLALRFEFRSLEWHDTSLMFWFSNKSEVHDVDGDEPQAHWRPYLNNGVKSNYITDGWITVTIPLSDFKYDKEESEERSINSFNELVDLHIIFFGAADDAYNAEVWMDNFRIVKYK